MNVHIFIQLRGVRGFFKSNTEKALIERVPQYLQYGVILHKDGEGNVQCLFECLTVFIIILARFFL